jgi:hypothetical protein
MRKLITTALSATIAAAALTVSAPSHAGSPASPPYAYCSSNADGSGSCAGTLEGFQVAAPNPIDAAYFYQWDGGAGFWARFNGVSHLCVKSSSDPLWFQTASIPSNEWFSIQWNAQGQCTSLFMQTVSYR